MMNSKLTHRLSALEAAAAPAPDVELPEIPAEFTGTLIVSAQARIWIPDNGRGPVDHPKPNIVRIAD